MTVTSMLDKQEMIIRAGRLKAITSTGLVPASYTAADLLNLEEQLVFTTSAVRFCRIDHADMLNELIRSEWRDGRISWQERNHRINSSYMRLGERYGVKPESLRAEVSAMRRWSYDERIEGVTVQHYRVIPAAVPQCVATQLLIEASEQQWSVADLQSACYEQIDMSRQPEELSQELQDAMSSGKRDWKEWTYAEQWIHRNTVDRLVTDGPNRCVLHGDSGVLTIESDTEIRFIVQDPNHEE